MKPQLQVARPYTGKLFNVEVLTYSDEQGRTVTREIVRHPGAVLVIPVLDPEHVVMIRNYRVAVEEVLWEFPAGKLEPGEDPLHAAGRELEEETGYQSSRISKLGEFYTSPGFANELMHVFLAQDLTRVGQRLEAGEHIQVQVVRMQKVLEMVRENQIRDAKSIAGLLMWQSRTAALDQVGTQHELA